MPPRERTLYPRTAEEAVPGFAAALVSQPSAFMGRFTSRGGRGKSSVAAGLWAVAMPGAARDVSADSVVASFVRSHPTGISALVGAWYARVNGLTGTPVSDNAAHIAASRRMWLERHAIDPSVPPDITAVDLVRAVQALVVHTVHTNPVIRALAVASGCTPTLDRLMASATGGALSLQSENTLSRVPVELMDHLCAKIGRTCGAIDEADADAIRTAVPRLLVALSAAQNDGLLPPYGSGLNDADHVATALMFSTVFDLVRVSSAERASFLAYLAACYTVPGTQSVQLAQLLSAVKNESPRVVSVICAVARGVQCYGSVRTAVLDTATIKRQAATVDQVHAGVDYKGVMLFCHVCGRVSTPLKRTVWGVVRRSVRAHARYEAVRSSVAAAAPTPSRAAADALAAAATTIEPTDRRAAVGHTAMLYMDPDPDTSGTIGVYVCKWGETPCDPAGLCAVDLRGIVYTRDGESYQICAPCGGIFRHHARSGWSGCARVCDPCDISPHTVRCPHCAAQFAPRMETYGPTTMCERCVMHCSVCRCRMARSPTAAVLGEAVLCQNCTTHCTRCAAQLPESGPVYANGKVRLCAACARACASCGRDAGSRAVHGAPEQNRCLQCARSEERVEIRNLGGLAAFRPSFYRRIGAHQRRQSSADELRRIGKGQRTDDI